MFLKQFYTGRGQNRQKLRPKFKFKFQCSHMESTENLVFWTPKPQPIFFTRVAIGFALDFFDSMGGVSIWGLTLA